MYRAILTVSVIVGFAVLLTLSTLSQIFAEEVENIDNPKIFACGPEPMLHSIQKMLGEKSIPAQFSVESYMACGIGICQGCAIPKNQNDGYFLVCKDGPVFESNEVRFD